MILIINADTSYHSEPHARSRAAGYFYLGNNNQPPTQPTKPNGAIHVICPIMRNVMSSAAKAEVGAAFECGKEGCPIRTTLEELGHPQPATPLQTDNKCAEGIINGTTKQKRSKAIDMRFYWLADRVSQGQYNVYWAPGDTNLADYFSKHHPPAHHQKMRPVYLHTPAPSNARLPPPLPAPLQPNDTTPNPSQPPQAHNPQQALKPLLHSV